MGCYSMCLVHGARVKKLEVLVKIGRLYIGYFLYNGNNTTIC
jgi:hypothetical protein